MTASVRWLRFVGLMFLVIAPGCSPDGPKLTPVTGKVSVNGKPAAAALLFLHRKGKSDISEPTPYATADADGAFQVVWQPGVRGALPGEYVVTVTWPDMTKEPDGNGARPDLLRGAFDKIPASTLKATVHAERTELAPLELTLTAVQAAKPVVKDRNNK